MKRFLLLLLLLASVRLPLVWAQAPPAAPEAATQDSGQSTFKVDVRLVNVFATVVDAHGAPVANLQKSDFQVLEDGIPQQIAVFDRESELPLSIVLAVDTSLSTRKDIKLELESARRFAHSIVRPVDGLALYQFSEYVDEVTPFTSNLGEIDRGIERVHVGAATALYDAIYLGSLTLEDRQGRKVLVVITDGGDTASKVDYAEAVREAQQAEAIVYSIIVVPIEASAGRNTGGEHALIEIARATGGKYYYASSIGDLDTAFRQISDELRTQYLLAYYPKVRVANSDFRQIEVRVLPPSEGEHYIARHRAGYYTSKSH